MDVMIADVSSDVRKAFGSLLKNTGHKLEEEATTGRQAIAICEEVTLDVVFLDSEITDPGCLETLRAITSLPYGIHVVVITTGETEEFTNMVIDAGAVNFGTKPFQKEEVVALLDGLQRI